MTILFFMPWVRIKEPAQVGPLLLTPYTRNKLPGEHGLFPQSAYDGVLGRYGDLTYAGTKERIKPVQSAVIVTWPDDAAETIVDNDQGSDRLIDGQFLTFCALANRGYWHGTYVNSDTLTMIGQPFSLESPAALTVRSRMRNGHLYNHVGMSEGIPVHMRPMHAALGYNLRIDIHLFAALLGARDRPIYSRLVDAVLLFNQANTDSTTMPPNAEVIMLRAAFETLFGINHESKELRRAFSAHFRHPTTEPEWHDGPLTEKIWRERWPKNVARPLDAWVQDFCNVRNTNAHGRSGPTQHAPSIWNLANHLMFASWILPLVVKQLLADEGLYTLSQSDTDYRQQFEKFFSRDILALTSFEKMFWTEVDEEISLTDIARRMYPGANNVAL